MPTIDAAIFAAIGEVAVVSGQNVPGIFTDRYREIPLPDGAVAGVHRTFDTQISDLILGLAENAPVQIGSKTFRMLQRLPDKGDESGRVTLVLGT